MGKSKETISERIKKIRKELGFTQDEFAKKIYVSHGQISAMELKRSIVNDQNISLICTSNRFKDGVTVNEKWLREGQGEMFVPKAPDGRPKLFEDKKEIPQDEEELVGIYRQLSRPNKTVAVKQIDILLESQDEPVEVEKGDMRKLG